MTVCSFFLQGRCRYGDKCWNEHPRGGGGGGGRGGGGGGGGGGGDYRGNQPSRGGFGNRVWVNPSQRPSGNYIQPSTFSRGGDWSRNSNSTRDVKSSEFSFSTQNRFSTLNPQRNIDKGGQSSADDNTQHVDTIQSDMEIWQGSGQWPFSCYSVLSVQISGFVELSPEELRLEYYTRRASGDLQEYVNSVQQLANQWRSRVEELKAMNNSTQMSVISELKNSSPQTSSHGFGSTSSGFSSAASVFGSTSAASGFGSTSAASGFGSTSAATGFGSGSAASGFGSTSEATGFGSTSAATGFGSRSAASGFGTGGFGSGSQSSNSFSFSAAGFGSAGPAQHASAATFSFAAPAAENKPNTEAVGSASEFSFKSGSSAGSGFGSSAFGSSAFGGAVAAENSADPGHKLFTAHSDLSAEELKEFTAKRFTLGQIPLKAPPADLLVV